jgi:imidazolonepropionase-like amidohydrolase
MRRRLLLISGFALAFCLAGRATSEETRDSVLAIVGGEVRVGDGPALRDATVIVRGGRIEAVGVDVAVPADARRIDAKGAVVTPGFIDADSALPVDAYDRNFGRGGVEWRAADAVRVDDERFATALRQGVTSFVATGGVRAAFGGVAALVANETDGARAVVADGPVVVNFANADNSGGVWGAQRFAEIRGVFVAARDRRDELERRRKDAARYEEKRAADVGTKEERLLLPPELLEAMSLWTPAERAAWREAAMKSMGREKDYVKPKDLAKPPARVGDDVGLDLVISTFGGKDATPRRAWLRAESDVDVAAALRLAQEFGLAATVAGGEGLAAHAKELEHSKIPVVVTELGDTASRDDGPLTKRAPGLAARLVAAGLRPAFGSGAQGGGARFLRLLAAEQIGEGLSPEDALRAVTVWAAEAAGVADRVGSIAVGRRADVVVWDGDPFAAATKPRVVIVGGRVVEERR